MPKIKRRNTTRNTTFERPGMHLIKTLIPNEMLAHGAKKNQVFKNDFLRIVPDNITKFGKLGD
jgi:hypothetical protein